MNNDKESAGTVRIPKFSEGATAAEVEQLNRVLFDGKHRALTAAAQSLAPASQAAAPAGFDYIGLRAELQTMRDSTETYGAQGGSEAARVAFDCAIDALDDFAALAGAAPVEAAKIPAGWQPIETAPREIIKQLGGQGYGAYILASNGFDVVRCRWWQHVDGSRNFIKDGGLSFHATHWMNLPAAPAPEAQ